METRDTSGAGVPEADGAPSGAGAAPNSASFSKSNCIVCMEDHLQLWGLGLCGHLVCEDCAGKFEVKDGLQLCHLCRKPFFWRTAPCVGLPGESLFVLTWSGGPPSPLLVAQILDVASTKDVVCVPWILRALSSFAQQSEPNSRSVTALSVTLFKEHGLMHETVVCMVSDFLGWHVERHVRGCSSESKILMNTALDVLGTNITSRVLTEKATRLLRALHQHARETEAPTDGVFFFLMNVLDAFPDNADLTLFIHSVLSTAGEFSYLKAARMLGLWDKHGNSDTSPAHWDLFGTITLQACRKHFWSGLSTAPITVVFKRMAILLILRRLRRQPKDPTTHETVFNDLTTLSHLKGGNESLLVALPWIYEHITSDERPGVLYKFTKLLWKLLKQDACVGLDTRMVISWVARSLGSFVSSETSSLLFLVWFSAKCVVQLVRMIWERTPNKDAALVEHTALAKLCLPPLFVGWRQTQRTSFRVTTNVVKACLAFFAPPATRGHLELVQGFMPDFLRVKAPPGQFRLALFRALADLPFPRACMEAAGPGFLDKVLDEPGLKDPKVVTPVVGILRALVEHGDGEVRKTFTPLVPKLWTVIQQMDCVRAVPINHDRVSAEWARDFIHTLDCLVEERKDEAGVSSFAVNPGIKRVVHELYPAMVLNLKDEATVRKYARVLNGTTPNNVIDDIVMPIERTIVWLNAMLAFPDDIHLLSLALVAIKAAFPSLQSATNNEMERLRGSVLRVIVQPDLMCGLNKVMSWAVTKESRSTILVYLSVLRTLSSLAPFPQLRHTRSLVVSLLVANSEDCEITSACLQCFPFRAETDPVLLEDLRPGDGRAILGILQSLMTGRLLSKYTPASAVGACIDLLHWAARNGHLLDCPRDEVIVAVLTAIERFSAPVVTTRGTQLIRLMGFGSAPEPEPVVTFAATPGAPAAAPPTDAKSPGAHVDLTTEAPASPEPPEDEHAPKRVRTT
jgi:hypothetical protein